MYGNGYQITRVAISASNGPRAPLFAPAAKEIFGMGGVGYAPGRLGRRHLGQTAQTYYANGKTEIAAFDALKARAAKIANQTARDQIISDYGLNDPTNNDKAQYMRNAVAGAIATADGYTPTGYEEGFPSHGPNRADVGRLHDFNSNFGSDVSAAETQYGILPEPVVIERIVTTPGIGSSPVPYLLAAGGLFAALLIVGVIKV